MLLWDDSVIQVTDVVVTEFCLSASIHVIYADCDFKITTVYGPTAAIKKDDFFAELVAQKPPPRVRWLVLGDFNQIHRARDKNKPNVNRSRIVRFRNALHTCELNEIHLQNRRFTWTNGRQNPTLCKLDAVFCNAEWDFRFGTHVLHALSSSLSDHCPLLLADDSGPFKPRTFRFENFWLRLPGFNEVVKDSWDAPISHTEPYHILFHKLKRLGGSLSKWCRSLFPKPKILLHAALLVILQFDIAQEHRQLSVEERGLHARLKRKVLSLSILERARKKQCSRIRNVREGDANTRFFHLKVNWRRRKNYMHRLKHNNGWVTEHEHKEEIIHDHFSSALGKGESRTHDFKWDVLHFGSPNLEVLAAPISEEEVKCAIHSMPSDKAPGPDGFTGAFFKRCWEIIKVDVMNVIGSFGNLHTSNLHWLNSANVVLLPKKEGAEEITDYRPISLIHAIAKIIAKVLALRLGPLMNELVSNAQSAFIKKRSIHDNFLYVKNLATRLHKSKTPSLLFKLDIRKAFDSVRWDYILDLLQRRGFPSRFRDWIAALLSTSTSRILLNGVAGHPIHHGRGLRQGDPLSPLLFVIAIDPLQQLLEKATSLGLLQKIRGRGTVLRTSLYADDAAIFVAPFKEDIQNLTGILRGFGVVTGLCTNIQKSSVVPIRCDGVNLDLILDGLPVVRASFPMRYLGLPLSTWKLRLVDFQHLVDKCAGKCPTWYGRFFTMAGRGTLVKSVLASQAIYHLTPLVVPSGLITKLNNIYRAFFWAGSDKVTGGQCKVNWEAVCRPTNLGGLGMLHTDKFARALRLRWPWLLWKDPSKIWAGLGIPCTKVDMELFYAATTISVGDGAKTHFWEAPWLEGRKPMEIAPLIYASSSRKNWSIRQALSDDAWIHKIKLDEDFTMQHLFEFVDLSTLLQNFTLDDTTEDSIVWNLTADGEYSAKSAYHAQLLGSTSSDMRRLVWKVWAPPKTKYFAWLALQNRLWTADRLARRNWQNCGLCPLCKSTPETVDHLLLHCRFTARVWSLLKDWLALSFDQSLWATLSLKEWWHAMTSGGVNNRKAVASLVLLTSWEIWNERNARVFRNKFTSAQAILLKIKNEAKIWVLAGAKRLGEIIPGE